MPNYRYTFISHAHADNTQCDPFAAALTRLGVPHYYDRETPQVGHSLSLALQREIERAGALVIMVSATSLDSFWVGEELDMFFALMAEDRSRKLIPIKIGPCDLPPRLKARWWLDATNLTHDEVVAQLTTALQETVVAPSPAAPAVAGPTSGGYSRVVDWRHNMGDHTTITDAIAAAHPGERILVRAGLYEGGLTIDKPLEIIGDGQRGDVEVRASGVTGIWFNATQGRIANLTVRQVGGENCDAVNISSGRLVLEDCDVSSTSRTGLTIYNGADPRVRRCRVHDNKESGVWVLDNGQGTLEDCDIYNNGLAGVEVKSAGAPTLRQCRIYAGKQGGVMVHEQGLGLFEDCDISGNALAGVEVKISGAPTVRRCRVHDGKEGGLMITDQGGGIFEDCDIFGNGLAGVEIKSGGAPTIRQCRVRDGRQSGVMAHEQGQGLVEDCDIFGNVLSGLEIKSGATPTIRHCRVHNDKGAGALVCDKGQGLIEDCDIYDNALAGVEVKEGAAPTVRKCRINRNTGSAVYAHDHGAGVFEDNDLRNNTLGAWDISQSTVTRQRNTE